MTRSTRYGLDGVGRAYQGLWQGPSIVAVEEGSEVAI